MYISYIHVALAVYTRSTAAYEALRSFNILQLPSVSSLKHYTSANIEAPGTDEIDKRLSSSKKQYEEHKKEWTARRKKEPLAEGVLIVDEVKVLLIVVLHVSLDLIHI